MYPDSVLKYSENFNFIFTNSLVYYLCINLKFITSLPLHVNTLNKTKPSRTYCTYICESGSELLIQDSNSVFNNPFANLQTQRSNIRNMLLFPSLLNFNFFLKRNVLTEVSNYLHRLGQCGRHRHRCPAQSRWSGQRRTGTARPGWRHTWRGC